MQRMPKRGKSDQFIQKGCKCKRSACRKNYCECYVNKLRCIALCKCVSCRNRESDYLNEEENANAANAMQVPPAPTSHERKQSKKRESVQQVTVIELQQVDAATVTATTAAAAAANVAAFAAASSMPNDLATKRPGKQRGGKAAATFTSAAPSAPTTPVQPTQNTYKTKQIEYDGSDMLAAAGKDDCEEERVISKVITEEDINNCAQCLFTLAEECEECMLAEEYVEQRILEECQRTISLFSEIAGEFAAVYGNGN